MRSELQEYFSLPTSSDELGDCKENYRKAAIIRSFDELGNDPEITGFLLQVLRNRQEYDLARVEAIQVAGLYVTPSNPHFVEVRAELKRIHEDSSEDEMIRGWAARYFQESK